MLTRRDGLSKVVKVLKGRKTVPVLNANELIFPKSLSSKGTHLNFTDIKREEIKLKLSCDIGFSTNPIDTKMHLAEYVKHINEFPSSAIVFRGQESRESLTDLHTGMEIVLQECKTLHSCICSTDVHGEEDYPLMELLATLPIEIKAISSPRVSLKPIYDTAKKVYESFDLLSMVQTSMFLAQNTQHSYEEIRRNGNYHDLELPAEAYAINCHKGST